MSVQGRPKGLNQLYQQFRTARNSLAGDEIEDLVECVALLRSCLSLRIGKFAYGSLENHDQFLISQKTIRNDAGKEAVILFSPITNQPVN
jgi:hypothetical protein